MEKNLTRAYLALAVVCVVWGTTYFGIRIGVATFPPLLFSGIRHTIAGVILLAFIWLSGKGVHLSRKHLLRQIIPGVLMIALGNGVMGWSERYIPSGLAALITSVMPIYVVAINFGTGIDRRIPNKFITGGLLLGGVGIVLIFRDNIRDLANPEYLIGVLVAFAACLAWSLGSVYSKHKPTPTSALTNAAIQLASGGVFLLVMGLCFDNLQEIKTISSDSIYALIYLIVVGSLFSYSCFVYALEKLPVGLVSIYAYINPFIAILLGSFFLNEKLTWVTGLALATAVSGVYLINRGYQLQKKAA